MKNINNKHAFLIMAYDDFDFLQDLLKAIDDERNDIYLHVDKRADTVLSDLKTNVHKSRITIIERMKVTWGSEDQIVAEIQLLKASTEENSYMYYHLLSGHDFPLVSQDELHHFFNEHQGTQFIDCRYKNIESMLFRIKYYFPFQVLSSGKSIFNRLMNKMGVQIQKILKVNRTSDVIKYGYGGNWFSITDELARYIVSMEDFIKKNFFKGLCADEMFLQTLWLNAPFFDLNNMYINSFNNSPLEQNYRNALRAVDFLSGTGVSPCTFTESDYDMLKQSNCMFARKLDSVHSKGLVKRIKADWK